MRQFHARLPHRGRGAKVVGGLVIALAPLTAAAQPAPDTSSPTVPPTASDEEGEAISLQPRPGEIAPPAAVSGRAEPSAAGATPDDNLPFDGVSPSQLETQASGDAGPTPPRTVRFMRPEGVEDPFPDRAPQLRPYTAGVLLTLGFGLATASAVVARLALLPDCGDENDVTTCAIPDGGDIGVRSGRLFGAVAFGVGGAALGAFGGRELGRYLQQARPSTRERRRRVALGLGSASVAAGVAGIVVGSAVFGVGAHRSLRLARGFESVDPGAETETLARQEQTIAQVQTARAGLMVLVAAPTFLATGISLLVHRPRRRLSLTPQLGRTRAGLTATVRF